MDDKRNSSCCLNCSLEYKEPIQCNGTTNDECQQFQPYVLTICSKCRKPYRSRNEYGDKCDECREEHLFGGKRQELNANWKKGKHWKEA